MTLGEVRRLFVPEAPTLDVGALLRGYLSPRPFTLPFGRQTLLFAFARDALLQGLQALRLEQGEEVLVPAFICDAVLQPFQALGVNVRYYEVTPRLEPELSDLQARITGATRAVLHVHFFGFPSGIDAVADLCRARGLALIEDCAHASFSRSGERHLGSVGDLSIFSFRKFAGLGDGGALVVNRAGLEIDPPVLCSPPPGLRTGLELCELGAKRVLRRLPVAAVALRSVWAASGLTRAGSAPSAAADGEAVVPLCRGISGPARRMLSAVDVPESCRRRQENFALWLDLARTLPGVVPIYETLPPGVVPYHFPVRVPDRRTLLRRMSRGGVFLEPTFDQAPIRHRSVVTNRQEFFPVTECLAREIVSLPVYQELGAGILASLAAAIRRELNG